MSLLPVRIIEDFLGLEHSFNASDSDSSHTSSTVASTPTPQPTSGSGSKLDRRSEDVGGVPIEQYAGEYHDPGYGSFTLCAPTSTTPQCKQYLSDWFSITPAHKPEPDTLYGGSDRVWYHHLRLQRTNSSAGPGGQGLVESFFAQAVVIFPHGYGRNSTPFSTAEISPDGFHVDCVVDGRGSAEVVGCGFMDVEEGPRFQGDTVPERADVWFEKINV